MITLKKYTKEEVARIMEVFGKSENGKGKKKLAKELNRTVVNLQSKYYYELSMAGKVKGKPGKKPQQKKTDVVVTHVNKPRINKNTTIYVGDTKVVIPSTRFRVNGVLIEC